MTPARRDRFEQAVQRLMQRPVPDTYEAGVSQEEAITLLRCEHRAVVRLVKRYRQGILDRQKKWTLAGHGDKPLVKMFQAQLDTCDDLLAALTRRQKGTR